MISRSAALLFLLAVRVAAGAPVAEEKIRHAGTNFRVVRLAPERVRLLWKDAAGRRYETFEGVQADFAKHGKSVTFLTNAAIYEPGGIPSGLFVADGKPLRPLNLADAPGNFFLKPNGVCSFGKSAAIVTSTAWRTSPAPEVKWAIQGGPMLLIGGRRHPAFREGSTSKLLRSGVGIDAEGRFVFAITAAGEVVNFWDFAGLFLKLGCRDALFLDGDISQMAVNPPRPLTSNRFGAIFAVAD